ncbi:ProQ/FINO family protein [uncultured Lamprocystis sp.]|jgi:ProP effector|uniref:ProQ/FINO family protein n=1 Tax=uncultured Lamprocystis sp. TaxID=543132 RepID=UPI0025D9C6ED|nr:ProQ/FINO family protein [uncultured Lamprocystis sp.]
MKKPPNPALLALREAFPLAFPADAAAIRPLAIGIHTAIQAWAATRPDLRPAQVAAVLPQYCGRTRYRQTLVAGALRIDLQGQPTEPVTAEAAALAAASIERARAAADAKAATRAQRAARHAAAQAAAQAALQAQAAARRAAAAKAKAPKPAKQPKPKQAQQPAVPAPVAAPVAPTVPVVVIKKRRRVVG